MPQNPFPSVRWSKAVNASEDTKCAPSVVTETLKTLSEKARVCHEKINQLEAAQSFNRADVLAEVGKLLDACQNLRDAILSEDSAASWKTKEDLHTLVTRLDEAASKRRRYLDLAQFLSAGTVSHRRERTRLERLALRDKAVAELMEISDQSAPPELPGPAVEKWLEWACSLEDDANEPELLKLKTNFPRLDDFVRQLEIDWWHNGEDIAPIEQAPSIPAPAPVTKNGSNGSHLNGHTNGNGLHKKPVLEEQPVEQFAAPVPVPPPAIEPLPPAVEIEPSPELPDLTAILATPSQDEESSSPFVVDEGEEMELPAEMLSASRKGKVSLFPWEEVEQFARHIEKAKVERKESRKIRALLATSQWLEPREHSPLSHPKCGIRALTDYSGTSDLVLVAPSDVMRVIEADEGLPLFTGGADLLRWGLLQPSERNFQGIASVRRLSPEHLKAWFSEIYRIALSDRQIDDLYNLTSGIPLLVGELHKLIIPVPDDPPTWLGLARWMEIKTVFEKQLPAIAQDLKKGAPAVRLTDREISLLNMVVIVSGDSTRETIVANLSENWERYQHPEYRALSSRDEASLALLMELGLLPMRNVTGVIPSKALVPVKHDDAIRKIVELM